jgi:hypothetical protein
MMQGRALVTGAANRGWGGPWRCISPAVATTSQCITTTSPTRPSRVGGSRDPRHRPGGRRRCAPTCSTKTSDGRRLSRRAAAALGGPMTTSSSTTPPSSSIRHASRPRPAKAGTVIIESNLRAPVVLTQALARRGARAGDGRRTESLWPSALVVNMIDHARAQADARIHVLHHRQDGAVGLHPHFRPGTRAEASRVNAIGPGPTLKGARQSEEHFRRQRAATLLERRGADPDRHRERRWAISWTPARSPARFCAWTAGSTSCLADAGCAWRGVKWPLDPRARLTCARAVLRSRNRYESANAFNALLPVRNSCEQYQ